MRRSLEITCLLIDNAMCLNKRNHVSYDVHMSSDLYAHGVLIPAPFCNAARTHANGHNVVVKETNDAILYTVKNILDSLKNSNNIGLFLLPYFKAYDKVELYTLFAILHKIGFSTELINQTEKYYFLKDRKLCDYSNINSDEHRFSRSCLVPQGAILGSLIFLI